MRDLCSHWGQCLGPRFRLAGGGPPAAAGLSKATSSLACVVPGLPWPEGQGERPGCPPPRGRLPSPRGVVRPPVVWLPLKGALQEWKLPVSEGLGPEMGTASLRLPLVGHRTCSKGGDIDPACQWKPCQFVGIFSRPPAPCDCAPTCRPGLSLPSTGQPCFCPAFVSAALPPGSVLSPVVIAWLIG